MGFKVRATVTNISDYQTFIYALERELKESEFFTGVKGKEDAVLVATAGSSDWRDMQRKAIGAVEVSFDVTKMDRDFRDLLYDADVFRNVSRRSDTETVIALLGEYFDEALLSNIRGFPSFEYRDRFIRPTRDIRNDHSNPNLDNTR